MPKSRRGAGPKPKVGKLMGSSGSGRTRNPKFAKGVRDPATVDPTTMHGMDIGGVSDADVRAAANLSGVQLKRQLKKDKSAGLKP